MKLSFSEFLALSTLERQNLKKLIFTNICFCDVDANDNNLITLASTALAECQQLQELRLFINGFYLSSPEQLTAIFTSFIKCQNLQLLDLSGCLCLLSTEQLTAIFTVLIQYQNLQLLALSGNNFKMLHEVPFTKLCEHLFKNNGQLILSQYGGPWCSYKMAENMNSTLDNLLDFLYGNTNKISYYLYPDYNCRTNLYQQIETWQQQSEIIGLTQKSDNLNSPLYFLGVLLPEISNLLIPKQEVTTVDDCKIPGNYVTHFFDAKKLTPYEDLHKESDSPALTTISVTLRKEKIKSYKYCTIQ